MANLLIDEHPLVVQPTLAKVLGLNEAIVVQQIHYWIKLNEKTNKNFHSGYYWTYNSIADWQKVFYFWSEDTVRRTFKSLENLDVLIVANLNIDKRDRTKWYTLDYEKIDSLANCIYAECHNGSMQNTPVALSQNAIIQPGKMHKPLPETTTEITTESKDIPPLSPVGDDVANYGESLLVKTATGDDKQSSHSKTRRSKKTADLTQEQMQNFEKFWSVWPYKVSRGQAEITWGKLNPDESLLELILVGVERAKQYDRRFSSGYTPHPSTWLNAKGWADELNGQDGSAVIVPLSPSNSGQMHQAVPKKNKFVNYEQRHWNFDELKKMEEELLETDYQQSVTRGEGR